MRKMKILGVAVVSCLAIGFVAGRWSDGNGQQASAQRAAASTGKPARISPTKALADRDMYFPGTEDLARDEMRVTALGTGMPTARPKQAAACFLVELGNGDKFLFDIGSGSHERIAAQKIPPDLATSIPFSDFTKSGVLPFSDVVGPIYEEINEL